MEWIITRHGPLLATSGAVSPAGLKRITAPGVEGYTVDHEGVLYIPLIAATKPGNGDVSRYLDSLPRDRTVRVPSVMSEKLEDMLKRRGFVMKFEPADGGKIDIMERAGPPVTKNG